MSHAPFNTAFAHSVMREKYMDPHGETNWNQTAARVAYHPVHALRTQTRLNMFDATALENEVRGMVENRTFMPGGRYLYGCGNDFHQVQNCLLLDVEDTREGWADLAHKTFMSLMTGAGIGVYYGKLRENGALIRRTGGVATGPVPLAIAINEQARAAVQGGNRRSAIWAGLLWSHPDIFSFINAKRWPEWLREQKAKEFNTAAPLDMTNISVCLDDDFFEAYEGKTFSVRCGDGELRGLAPDSGTWHDWAQRVYWAAVDSMTQTGEPGFSVDLGDKRDEKLRNACTEITSADDSDICNLGGLVLPRFDTPQKFEKAVIAGVKYLTAGTFYSDVPYEKVAETRDKNRRLGLDLMGVHEFLLRKGVGYGTDEAFEVLEPFMAVYDRALEFANEFQSDIGCSLSVGATAGSPTGTRAIGAETSTASEPITYTAYKRAIITSGAALGDTKRYTYVVDPTVKRLVDEGVLSYDAEVEDSASLAETYELRFRQQAYMQRHVDHALSMTVNLPHVMHDEQERRAFGNTLYRYLPQLRGMTVYPDGAIPGQPIIKVPLAEALASEGMIVEENEDKCASGVCGI